MSRTEGSGWGGGAMFYQKCALCTKKKALYSPIVMAEHHKPFKCTWCKDRFESDTLLRIKYVSQLSEPQKALNQLDKLSKEADKTEAKLDKITGMPKGITKIGDKIKYLQENDS